MGRKWRVFFLLFLFALPSYGEPGSGPEKAMQRAARPVYQAVDRLAADSRSALYRSGVMDSRVTDIPPEVEARLFANPGKETLSLLLEELMHGTDDQFLKAKRIHDWITWNIAYDSNLLTRLRGDADPDGSVEPMGVLKYQRTNCKGLARLYETMGRTAGLEVRYQTGFLKNSENKHGRLSSHAWNLVRIEGTWYIIDCSADSRFFYSRKAYTKKADYAARSDNLFIHPQAKVLAYLAEKPADQLLNEPVTLKQFRSLPRAEITIYKYGIHFADAVPAGLDTCRVENKSGGADLYDRYSIGRRPLEIRLQAPSDVFVEAFLEDQNRKRVPGYAFAERDGDSVACRFSAPVPSRYGAVLHARSLASPDRVNVIYRFILDANSASDKVVPAIQPTFRAALYGVTLTGYGKLSGSDLWMEIDYPADIMVVSVLRGEDGKRCGRVKKLEREKGSRFEFTANDLTKCQIVVSASITPDQTGKGNQRVLTILPGKLLAAEK